MNNWVVNMNRRKILEHLQDYGVHQEAFDYIIGLEKRVEQLENIRKEAIRYIENNKLYDFNYDEEELFERVSDKVVKDYLLNILNKGE